MPLFVSSLLLIGGAGIGVARLDARGALVLVEVWLVVMTKRPFFRYAGPLPVERALFREDSEQ